MSTLWYFSQQGETRGPVSEHELRQLLNAGKLNRADLVWREGMPNWVPAGSIGTLGESAGPPPPPPRHTPLAAPVRSTEAQRPAPHVNTSQTKLLWATVIVLIILTSGLAGWVLHSLSRSNSEPVDRAAERTVADSSPRKDSSRRIEKVLTQSRSQAPQPSSQVDGADGRQAPIEIEPPSIQSADDDDENSTPSSDGPVFVDGIVIPSQPPDETAKNLPITANSTPSSTPSLPQSAPTKTGEELPRAAKAMTLFQEIDVHRRPSFAVSGVNLAQDLKYRLLSKLDVSERAADGTRSVSQVVVDAKLDRSDDLSRASMSESLRKLIGRQFSFKLDSNHEVFDFRGHEDNTAAIPVDKLGQGFMVTSVMDEDGWKELAELSFFLPDEKAGQGEKWVRQMVHDWGPLGSWSGETTFMLSGRSDGVDRVDFVRNMSYNPPDKEGGVLPFQINAADFKLQAAGGTILFDAQNQRVSSLQERFHVTGTIGTTVLGQASQLQMEEQQVMTIRLLDQRPSGQ